MINATNVNFFQTTIPISLPFPVHHSHSRSHSHEFNLCLPFPWDSYGTHKIPMGLIGPMKIPV